jgi:hypothetical protein
MQKTDMNALPALKVDTCTCNLLLQLERREELKRANKRGNRDLLIEGLCAHPSRDKRSCRMWRCSGSAAFKVGFENVPARAQCDVILNRVLHICIMSIIQWNIVGFFFFFFFFLCVLCVTLKAHSMIWVIINFSHNIK